MTLNPGLRLGPYEILEPVGAGGMGEVYRAKDTRLDRLVAIKVLPGHLSASPELRERFEREARTISSLSHPHICSLYDVGHQDGVDFLVMEFLEGQSLADKLAGEPLPAEEVLRLGVQIAEALSAAHRAGVVHRDLKPGNIMLTRSGAKLLDFGLAKMGVEAATPTSSLTMKAETGHPQTPLTAEGTILGTFQYMAPEQLEGKEADSRTDIFALGAVLYELATGKPAFQGKSQASLIASILKDQPAPISTIQAMTPPALDRVVRVCLEKDPEKRWQTAHDVALQLQWIAEGGSAAGVPRPVTRHRRSRERLAWIAAGVLGLGVIALGARDLMRPKSPAPRVLRYQLPAPHGVVSIDSPKLSPDGRYLAYNATDTTGASRIWIHPLDSFGAHPLAGTEGATRPCWSPDSKSLAFFAGTRLKRIDVSGGATQTLLDGVRGSDDSWGREGLILFDGTPTDSIQGVPASGGMSKPMTRIDRAVGETGSAWPHFLPDGKHFLYLALHGGGTADSLKLGEVGSFATRTLGPTGTRMEYTPPGYLLWAQEGTLLGRRFDPDKLRFTGEPFPVTEQVGGNGSGLADFSLSDAGILAYREQGGRVSRLAWVDREGRTLKTMATESDWGDPALSPDGTQVAVDRSNEGGPGDVWVYDTRRGTESRLTFDPKWDYEPMWSADGSRVFFVSLRDGNSNIYSREASGTGETIPVWVDSTGKSLTGVTRDGKYLIARRSSQETGRDVWAVPLTGDAKPFPVFREKFDQGHGTVSPDDRWIAYASDESGTNQIYVRPFPKGEGKWQISTQGANEPRWSADGTELYYVTLPNVLTVVKVETRNGFRPGIPKPLFTAPFASGADDDRNHYAVHGNGDRFLVIDNSGHEMVPPTSIVVHWTAGLARK
jgi:serine/threonine protein kinase